jgi:hypothetical protein
MFPHLEERQGHTGHQRGGTVQERAGDRDQEEEEVAAPEWDLGGQTLERLPGMGIRQ